MRCGVRFLAWQHRRPKPQRKMQFGRRYITLRYLISILEAIGKYTYRLSLTDMQITQTLAPTSLEIFNDSHLHAHHKAMQGSISRETHFRYILIPPDTPTSMPCSLHCRVFITSDAFKSKLQPARHRMVYALLKDEMATEGGIHALQLRTRTVEEDEKAKAKETS